jgi:hypothetical protein
MAVGAEHAEIRETVIVSHAVDVVDLNRKRFSTPCVGSASIAFRLEQPRFEQSKLEMRSAFRRANDAFDRPSSNASD